MLKISLTALPFKAVAFGHMSGLAQYDIPTGSRSRVKPKGVTRSGVPSSGPPDAVDRENLQAEVDQLRSEINRIADSANFNGIKLLDGSLAEKVAATKIDVVGPGLTTTKSEGAKGKYTASTAYAQVT